MSDGELYWVIKNGVRWSGCRHSGSPVTMTNMLGKMVAYVRHLPKLTLVEQKQLLHQSEEPMEHDDGPHDHSH